MKKIFLLSFLSLSLNAQSLELDKIRTDLYSKSGANVLKKVEISLEFEGEKLKENENKLTDAVNTVISGFFYEDIFTELGKNNFKKTLEKFIDKKYKIKINDIYILSLSGVEKFDLEEFKRFLESTEAKEKNVGSEVKKALDNLEIPQAPAVPNISNIKAPQIDQLFKDDNTQNQEDNGEIDINTLDIPKITDIEEKIKRDLIANPPQIFKESNNSKEKGFELNLDTNSTIP
ncbi:flagellar basal body-associated FliL family protein [Campylobacter jejuni]|uniref:Flagellar protein FliL n=1 Tax=Campylobacter jejuni TaxID=197 RepID=A0A6F9MTP2_CAMJU|nr:flagellar basal body-associated FliL family protein [Campylobacter coli]NHH48997.1 flagellar basal body-associated FliL family protein [Campylobacter coli]